MKKKAFTMVEMLVTLVCIGIMTACIGAFASAIKLNASILDERELISSHEYQDVLNLKANGSPAIANLKYSEHLEVADKHTVGETFSLSSKIIPQPDQILKFSSSNDSIVTVSHDGTCITTGNGLAYIEVAILTLGDDNQYHDLGHRKFFPIFVYDPTYEVAINNVNYYFYGGNYYQCWICVD